MDALVNDIFKLSGGRFKNKEGIFDEFANANFGGGLTRIARIIETALGKGYFRVIAEASSSSEKEE